MSRHPKTKSIKDENILTNVSSSDTLVDDKSKKALMRRRSRVPLIEQNRLMSFPMDENYVYRLVNDIGDRIEKFRKAGYEIIDRKNQEIDIDNRVQDPSWKHSALSQPVGDGIVAYCMRIPREWWEEDQKSKQRMIKESEDQMKRPLIKGISQTKVYGHVDID